MLFNLLYFTKKLVMLVAVLALATFTLDVLFALFTPKHRTK